MTSKSTRNIKPQTPGTQPDPNQMPEQEGTQPDPSEEITVTRGELQQMVSSMVEAQVVTEVKAARRRAELSKQPAREDLPRQEDIDASKLDRAVETRDGWLVPEVHPSDRARINAMKAGQSNLV